MLNHCPKCGKAVAEGTKFCDACGYNLDQQSAVKPVCPQCKTMYAPGTKFCIKDGARLTQPEEVVNKCVICGTTYPEGTRYCPADGGEVKPAIQAPYGQPGHNQQSFPNFNTSARYPKASVGNRLLAALLDSVITGILAIPAIIFFVSGVVNIAGGNGGSAVGMILAAILFYLLPLVYHLIKDGLGRGQSWGKKALDIMVINLDNNAPCDLGKSILRNFISGLVTLIPFVGWLIEPILVLTTDDGRKLGDKAANTQVIDKQFYN